MSNPPCPTPTKMAHRKVDNARKQAIKMALRSGDTLYGYRCPHGHWHVTSRRTWMVEKGVWVKHLLLARPHSSAPNHV